MSLPVERKADASALSDPLAMSRHWLEINKLRSKSKRKVDTKASKGRKLRYTVQSKLVNFMAPQEQAHPATDAARDDLFSSLFGARPSETAAKGRVDESGEEEDEEDESGEEEGSEQDDDE